MFPCVMLRCCGHLSCAAVDVGATSSPSAVVMNIVASLSALKLRFVVQSLCFLLTEMSLFRLLSHNLLLLLPRPLLIAPSPPILLLEPLFAHHPHSSVPPCPCLPTICPPSVLLRWTPWTTSPRPTPHPGKTIPSPTSSPDRAPPPWPAIWSP